MSKLGRICDIITNLDVWQVMSQNHNFESSVGIKCVSDSATMTCNIVIYLGYSVLMLYIKQAHSSIS